MGDWMLYLGGMSREESLGGFNVGGFAGDGYAAYGWGYLLPFGLLAMMLFVFADSLYVVLGAGTPPGPPYSGRFAIVGLMSAFPLSTAFNSDSIAGLASFTLRQPLQWLFLYAVVLWAIRSVTHLWNPVGAPRGGRSIRRSPSNPPPCSSGGSGLQT